MNGMTFRTMDDVLNPNKIAGNERRWDVGMLFRRNRQSEIEVRDLMGLALGHLE